MYLVERYLPGVSAAQLADVRRRAGAAATAMAEEGVAVAYVSSTFLPEEEAVFCLFDGPSAEAVAEANRRAGAPFDRITLAMGWTHPVRLHDTPRERGEER